MTGQPRLSPTHTFPVSVATLGYSPQRHGTGIVHLGLGAFHRAHQAVYTDDALARDGGDWRIVGVSLRSTSIAYKALERLALSQGLSISTALHGIVVRSLRRRRTK